MADAVKITRGTFNSLLGLDASKHVDSTTQPDDTSFVSRFSKSEVSSYLNRLFVKPRNQNTNISASGIISYLKPIHAKIGNNKLTNEKLKALAPEIEQSRILVSSSIMSPNDLQDGKFIFNFDNVPELEADPDLLKEVAELYDQFFNDTLNLGIKSYDWIGEAQYGSGSKAVLILPIATQADLRVRTAKETKKYLQSDLGFESFSSNLNDYTFSNKPLSWKDFFSTDTTSVATLVPSMEEFGVVIPTEYDTSRNTLNAKRYGSEYVTGIEDMIVNLKTKLSEGDLIRITEDPDVLRFHKTSEDQQKTSILDTLAKKYGWDKDPEEEEITYLNDQPTTFKHSGHPTIIELPSEAVIPIIVPGAPSEHLGYFILLDRHGAPLTIDESGMADETTGCKAGSPNAAYEAMFGSSCTRANFFSKDNSYGNMGNLIFSTILDAYIKKRMMGIFGRDDLSLSRFNALATILLHRTLEAKRSTLVFVPKTLLHYFCFDYDRLDGTGKSKTSEIQFLLSLRTTLMMANVVGMVNDAIDHKKVEFGVDEKNANIEGIMDLIANIFIEKNKLNGSIDPSEIMKDMYSNALTIVPKNIPGLSELSVDVSSGGGQSTRVDDNLLEQITNLLVSHLDVPPAALNQMSEPEFAKSLVTQNLFFAKKIRRYQNIWCGMMTEFVRSYSLFDTTFQAALRKKLLANVKHTVKDKLPSKVRKLADDNPNVYSTKGSTIYSILHNVSLDLATPNIVVDKTQFEEISTFIRNLDEMSNNFFPNDIVPSDDNLAQSALAVARAKWKKDQMMRFLSEVGSFNMVDIPDFDDMDPVEITDYIQQLQNLGSAINRQREAIADNEPEETTGFDNGGYDEYGGGLGIDESGMGGSSGDEFGPMPGENERAPDIPSEFSASETTVTSRQEESSGASMSSAIYKALRRNK